MSNDGGGMGYPTEFSFVVSYWIGLDGLFIFSTFIYPLLSYDIYYSS